eukprot:tig00020614_g12237.t1
MFPSPFAPPLPPTMYLGGHGLLGTPAPPPLYGASLAPVTGAYMPPYAPHPPVHHNTYGGYPPPPHYGQRKRPREPEPENYFCEACDRGFQQQRQLEEHKAKHVKCPRDDCSFVASKKVVFEHVHDAHNGVSSSRKPIILDTPEEIERWRAERRKHWPSESNVERKKHEDENRRARGEIVDDRSRRPLFNRDQRGRGRGRGGRGGFQHHQHEREPDQTHILLQEGRGGWRGRGGLRGGSYQQRGGRGGYSHSGYHGNPDHYEGGGRGEEGGAPTPPVTQQLQPAPPESVKQPPPLEHPPHEHPHPHPPPDSPAVSQSHEHFFDGEEGEERDSDGAPEEYSFKDAPAHVEGSLTDLDGSTESCKASPRKVPHAGGRPEAGPVHPPAPAGPAGHGEAHTEPLRPPTGSTSTDSSKQQPAPAGRAPGRPEQAGERRHQRPPCKYFARGFCKLGGRCGFSHDLQPGAKPAPPRPPPAPTHPRTLLQKLLSKEIRQEKNYIMQCFRYLVENKFPALPPAAAAAPLAPSL